MVKFSQPHESKISNAGINEFISLQVHKKCPNCPTTRFYVKRVLGTATMSFFFLAMPNLRSCERQPHNICGLETPFNFCQIRMNFDSWRLQSSQKGHSVSAMPWFTPPKNALFSAKTLEPGIWCLLDLCRTLQPFPSSCSTLSSFTGNLHKKNSFWLTSSKC